MGKERSEKMGTWIFKNSSLLIFFHSSKTNTKVQHQKEKKGQLAGRSEKQREGAKIYKNSHNGFFSVLSFGSLVEKEKSHTGTKKNEREQMSLTKSLSGVSQETQVTQQQQGSVFGKRGGVFIKSFGCTLDFSGSASSISGRERERQREMEGGRESEEVEANQIEWQRERGACKASLSLLVLYLLVCIFCQLLLLPCPVARFRFSNIATIFSYNLTKSH